MGEDKDIPQEEREKQPLKLLEGLLLKRKLFWILAAAILAADLWTKDAAISFVREESVQGIYFVAKPWFALVEVENQGGPWGLARQYPEILRWIRLAALGFVLFILWGTPYSQRFQQVCLGMVMGGALGNIWDSWTLGHVRDFLYFDLGFPPADPWPAFNLADSMICIGVIGLLLIIFAGYLGQRAADKLVDGNGKA